MDLIGRELDGRYRVVSPIGEGAMGVVYRATKLDGSGDVAVKVLNDDCSDDPDLRERFEREARALFGVQHPHILDVQDYGVIDGQKPYLVMELLEGQSLDAMVDDELLDPVTGYELARQLLTGLAAAHSQGVLHRDLKSENVFVVRHPDGRLHAKLLDFGLVKFVDDERWGEGKKLTVAGSVFGSPAYMSPEQGTGGAVDAASDVYSAGVVLYELVTGSWPFEADSRMGMLKAHLLEPAPTLTSGTEGWIVRPELEAVLAKSLAKERADRYQDATELLAALETVPMPAISRDPAHHAAGSLPVGSLPAPPMPPAPAQPHGPAQQPAQGVHVAPAAPLSTAMPTPIAGSPALDPTQAPAIGGAAPAKSVVPFIIAGVLVGLCVLSVLFGGLFALLR